MVIVDLAMKQKEAGHVGNHVGGFHCRRQDREHIRPRVVVVHQVAAEPMGRMEIRDITHIEQIPAHTLALLHDHHRPVAVEISVDGELEVGFCESVARERDVHVLIVHVGVSLVQRLLVGGADVGGHVLIHIPALVFVERGKEREDFSVDVLGHAVGVHLASASHDDGAHQAGSHVFVLVDV